MLSVHIWEQHHSLTRTETGAAVLLGNRCWSRCEQRTDEHLRFYPAPTSITESERGRVPLRFPRVAHRRKSAPAVASGAGISLVGGVRPRPSFTRKTMTEFKQELRHHCRNQKCRMKLPAPVSNPRDSHLAVIFGYLNTQRTNKHPVRRGGGAASDDGRRRRATVNGRAC